MSELRWLLDFEKKFNKGYSKEDLLKFVSERIEKLRIEQTRMRMAQSDDFKDILRLCDNIKAII